MNSSFNLNCCALLKKIQGDASIQNITPVNDAQFLIGKSWDASLRLNSPEVAEKHCTIEKVEASKWTVIVHENATVLLNDEVLPRGLPRLLEFNDKLRISAAISFHFKCSCMDGEDLSSVDDIDIQVIKRPKLSNSFVTLPPPPQPLLPPPQLTPAPLTEEAPRLPKQVPDKDLRSRYEQLVDENAGLAARLKKAEEVAVYWENEKNKTDTCYTNFRESYNSIVAKYTQLCKLKEESNYLRETVGSQTNTISRLQLQLNTLQQNYYTLESFKQNLENQNKQLNTDITVLRTRTTKAMDCNKMLQRKNNNLQTEINGLKREKHGLVKELECRMKQEKSSGSSNDNILSQAYSLTSSAQNDLSDLLESEFKCSICDEVYIEAVVTNCAHMFCGYCIKSWKSIKPNCPICRTILTKEFKVLPVDSFLNSLMPFVTENLRTSWLKITEERKAIATKESAVAMKASPSAGFPPFMSPTPQIPSYGPSIANSGNFHNVLMNVYRQIAHYEDVIDLTNDRIYGL
ncbi:E3 ubiquitin-protein ligase rnf8-like isoform X2 [Planococcus citri]|uniref:E3 ubiquitin-protein ligase rnf8-like isoform X2 n=1 Tax=Planococcus citri TaxID=170843 RepID=UPI0031F9939B